MASSYYGFVERDASNFVNYADVARNFVNVLEEEARVREEKKAAIDENTRQLNIKFNNLPQGESETVNNWTLKFGMIGSENMRAQEKLLKSGRMKYKDYILQRQNLIDGTDQMISTIKNVNEKYNEVLNRYKKGESQPIEAKIWEQVEGFGDFTKTMPYVRADGKVIIGWADKAKYDGKDIMTLTDDPNYFSEITALNTRLNQRFDTWDVKGTMDAMVDEMGIEINAFVDAKNGLGATGTIREVLDITKRTNLPKDLQDVVMSFEQVETKKLESYLTNPLNVSSVLTQRLLKAPNGKPYDITFDREARDANPNLILMKTNGDGSAIPDFSGDVGAQQQKDALEFLRLEARLRYDKKSELTTTPQIQLQERRPKTQPEYDREDQLAEAKNFAYNLVNYIAGNDNESGLSAKYFGGVLKDTPGAALDKKGSKIITKRDGKSVTYDLNDPQVQKQVLRSLVSNLNVRGLREDDIIKIAEPMLRNKTLNLTSTNTAFDAPPPQRDLRSEVKASIGNQIKPEMFKGKLSHIIGPKIKTLLSTIPGVKVTFTGEYVPGNSVTVTYTPKVGKKKTYNLNVNQSTDDEALSQVAELKKLFNDLDDRSLELAAGAPTD